MDTGSIVLIHLIELIDEADAFVGKDESSTLKCPFSSDGVFVHTSCQTDSTCALSGRVNNSVVDLLDVLEELRLGGTGVTEEEHVDVATNPMFLVHILGLASEHSQQKTFLDELMAVDGWSNGSNKALGNVLLAASITDFVLLLIGQLHNILVTLTLQVVDLNDCLEDRESVLDVCKVIVPVDVDSVDFNFITGTGNVDKIMQDEDLFLTGNTTGWHRAWCLLDRQLLIVTVDSLDLINSVGSARLAHDTDGQTFLSLIWVCVKDRSLCVATLTLEEHFGVLGENLSALGNHALELNQCVEMHLAQLTKLVLNGQLVNTHVDFSMELLRVVRVDLLNNLTCHSVEDRQHMSGLLSEPNS